jgi:hypothetical protein
MQLKKAAIKIVVRNWLLRNKRISSFKQKTPKQNVFGVFCLKEVNGYAG